MVEHGFCQPNSVVLPIKDRVVLAHEEVSDKKHILLQVHGHHCAETTALLCVASHDVCLQLSKTLINAAEDVTKAFRPGLGK